jgi:RND family efflux transporter MFP subunit
MLPDKPIPIINITLFVLGLCWLMLGCEQSTERKSSNAPATVENAVKESKLTTLVLTPEATKRLGIQTAKVKKKTIRSRRMLGGDLIIQPGHGIVISAPVPGLLLTTSTRPFPAAGNKLKKGQPIFQLLVLPTDGDLMSTQDQVAEKKVLLQVAKAKANRAKHLLDSKLGSYEPYEELAAKVAKEELALKIAKNRLSFLNKSELNTKISELTTLRIEVPSSGVLQKVFAVPGQTVAAGDPLFELASLNPLWVRVPVYAGDLESFNLEQDITVSRLGRRKSNTVRKVIPVAAPPSADPMAVTIDLFFELQNADGLFRPGERVNVNLPLQEDSENYILPYSSVVYDIHGGTWVYINTAPNEYIRQRIELKDVIDNQAIYRRGPPPATAVVILGTAELFGTEFGGGK